MSVNIPLDCNKTIIKLRTIRRGSGREGMLETKGGKKSRRDKMGGERSKGCILWTNFIQLLSTAPSMEPD